MAGAGPGMERSARDAVRRLDAPGPGVDAAARAAGDRALYGRPEAVDPRRLSPLCLALLAGIGAHALSPPGLGGDRPQHGPADPHHGAVLQELAVLRAAAFGGGGDHSAG